MRAMPDGKLDQLCVQESCELSRTRDRYGIECAVHDTGCGERDAGCEIAQRRAQIIVVQAVPSGLLSARGDSKWRQVLGVVKVTEIPCDRELEGATLVRGWIPFPQAAHADCVAFPLDFRSSHAAGELRVELPPICEPERSRRNQRETFNMLWVLEQIEHCEQPAPGIAAERQALSAEVQAQCIEISDVLPPPHGRVARDG